MIDDILRINQIHLNKARKDILRKEVNNPNTKDALAKYVRQVMERQLAFEHFR